MMERVSLTANGRMRVVSRVAHRGPIEPAALLALIPALRPGFKRVATYAGRHRSGRLAGLTVIDEEFASVCDNCAPRGAV